MRGWLYGTLAMSVAMLSVYSSASGDDGGKAADAEAITKGAKIYQTHCIGCHGPAGKPAHGGGEGGVSPPTLADNEWKNGGSDAAIFDSIKKGVPPTYAMVPWEGVVSDEDILNLVRYIRSIGPQGETASK